MRVHRVYCMLCTNAIWLADLAPIRCKTGVSHLLSYLRSLQKKKHTSQHLIWDTKSVARTPNLMNSARLHKVFQNFVVPWKIHIYKNLILSSDASRRDASNDKGCICKFLPQMGPTTRLKIILRLQQIPKYEKIDYPPVNHPSDWARNKS